MTNKELFITALIIVFATAILRFLPFIIIRKSIAERRYIKYLGDIMPYAMIALLVCTGARHIAVRNSLIS